MRSLQEAAARSKAEKRMTWCWNSARIEDPAVFYRLCNIHDLDQNVMQNKISAIEYCRGERVGGGETRPVIFVRTRGNDKVHEVVKGKDGVWWCNCPTWVFKGGRDRLKPCKHLVALIASGVGDPADWMQYLT